MKILIIEDDWDVLYLVSKTIEQNGYSVSIASTIEKAKQLFLISSYDLVISDSMLPHFNDFELVSIFKEKNNIPIILLSGINKDISKTTITNADAILSKPYYGKQLINLIKEKLTQYYPEVC